MFPAEMLAPTSDPQLKRRRTDRQHEWEIVRVLDKTEI